MSDLAKVVLVGRTNVGKSTLFNRLSVKVKSLTLDQEGVTRDFVTDIVEWQGYSFELVDTGGISLRKSPDILTETVRQRALSLLDEAALVLFICDGKVGLVPEDREIAKMLHKHGKKVVLVVNKMDSSMAQDYRYEFERLGYVKTVFISAQHGQGIADLLQFLVDNLPHKKRVVQPDPHCRIVLLGKPNVGKSSLMNLLLQKDRSIVLDEPGTTREAISDRLSFYKQDIEVTDTPGIRKKRAVKETLETMMVKSSFRAVENADIVLLLVNFAEGTILDQELKLAFYTFEQEYKGLIVLFNKEDLIDDYLRETMDHSLSQYKHLMQKIETLSISCKTGKNIGRILPLVQKVAARYNTRLDDDRLTVLFKEALLRKPLFCNKHELRVIHVKQVSTAPITLVMIVNDPEWFGPSQMAFFDRLMRKEYDLKGVPVKMIARKKG